MTTLRKELQKTDFHFNQGRLILKDIKEPYPGWFDKEIEGREIYSNNPILDQDYDDGYGGPECPAFIAEDPIALYFPYQYDGQTGIVKVLKNIDQYLKPENLIPYPGGG